MEYDEDYDLKEGIKEFENLESYNTVYSCNICSSSILIEELKYYNKKCIYLTCVCSCSKRINMKIKRFIIQFMNREYEKKMKHEGLIIVSDLKCYIHDNKFEFYCKDDKKNICSNCIESVHPNHTLIHFNKDKIRNKNEEIKNLINDDNILTDKSKSALKKFLGKLTDFFCCYPCYNTFKSIENIYKFCSDVSKFSLDINNINYEQLKKVRFLRELDPIRQYNKIISIDLVEKGISNIEILKSYNLNDLLILNLKKNNINDISPLSDINFQNLKRLHLEENKITDSCIDVFSKLNAPELEFLNIFGNYLNSPKIFKTFHRFTKLKKLYIGNNKFNDDFNEKYDCSQILKIGLSIGVFSEKSIEKISNFKFGGLKKLYLNSNNIHSISFVEKLNYEQLEEIWLMNNYIKDFIPLKVFKNIKIINLKNNQISDIQKLEEFVNNLPNLKKIILSENQINTGDQKNIKIVNEIKRRKIIIDIL